MILNSPLLPKDSLASQLRDPPTGRSHLCSKAHRTDCVGCYGFVDTEISLTRVRVLVSLDFRFKKFLNKTQQRYDHQVQGQKRPRESGQGQREPCDEDGSPAGAKGPPGRVYTVLVREDSDGRLEEEDSSHAANEWESVQGLRTLTQQRSGTPAAPLASVQPHHGATLRPGGGDRSPVHKSKTVILGAETHS